MPSSTKTLLLVIGLVLVACVTTKGKRGAKNPVNGEDTLEFVGLLDLVPADARLADRNDPLDPELKKDVEILRAAMAEKQHELEEWIVPLMTSYLPRGDQMRGRVVFDIGRNKPVEITSDGLGYIDVSAPLWRYDPVRLWSEVVATLYGCALTQSLPIQEVEPDTVDAFTELFLKHVMVKGLATYVTSQGAPVAGDDTPDRDMMLRDEKSERFLIIDGLMAEAKGSGPKELNALWHRIIEGETRSRLLGITGAVMAEAIEKRLSRGELMDAVALGPRAFYNAYMAGRPGELMLFNLPPDAEAPLDEFLWDDGDTAAH